jgi:release factor glutamine methyltransferase
MSGCSRSGGVLRPGGAVVVEIGASQASRIGVEAADAGFGSVEVETDLTGRDRIVTARKPT